MGPLNILDADDVGEKRTSSDFLLWVEEKSKELSGNGEAIRYARSGSPLPKKFFDEIFPLYRFVALEYGKRDDVLIQPNLDNDNFDATLVLLSATGNQLRFIETTYAKDGYDLALRMEALASDGQVSLTDRIRGRKGKPNRRIVVGSETRERSNSVPCYLSLVEKRIRDKANVSYGGNHILLVAVDDYLELIHESDWPALETMVRALVPTLKLDFGRIVFVGMAGKLFQSYEFPLPV